MKIRPQKINFLLVEDEALIRDGLRSLLQNEPFTGQIYEASNEPEFLEQIRMPIDIVLMDFRLVDTNGLRLVGILKERYATARVIMLTGLEGTELLLNLLRVGVSGIVYKLDGYKEILTTVEGVLAEGSYFSPKIMNIIQANAHRWDHIPPVILTPNENTLLTEIAGGLTTKEIAAKLKMTESTAETYRIRLIKKMGVLNTAGLIAYAYRNGIL
jgi:DNA-binding NarL/FixJ family response regulator